MESVKGSLQKNSKLPLFIVYSYKSSWKVSASLHCSVLIYRPNHPLTTNHGFSEGNSVPSHPLCI